MRIELHGYGKSDGGVYVIRNVVNGWFYVGVSYAFHRRSREHGYDLDSGKHPNKRLQRDYWKFGPDAFEFEVVALVSDLATREAIETETLRLAFGEGCYNIRFDSPPSSFRAKRTPEQNERNRLAHIGQVISPETRAKMSAAHKARHALKPPKVKKPRPRHSNEHKAKLAARMRAAWTRPEFVEKMKVRPVWNGARHRCERCGELNPGGNRFHGACWVSMTKEERSAARAQRAGVITVAKPLIAAKPSVRVPADRPISNDCDDQ